MKSSQEAFYGKLKTKTKLLLSIEIFQVSVYLKFLQELIKFVFTETQIENIQPNPSKITHKSFHNNLTVPFLRKLETNILLVKRFHQKHSQQIPIDVFTTLSKKLERKFDQI